MKLLLPTLLSAPALAANILLGNDDGFGSAQIRETYRLLKASGHDVLMVAPVDNESGQGGRSVFTNSRTLYTASEYNLVPAGSPSLGQDPLDPGIWYYNGTPAACLFVGLDYVVPNYWNNRTVDLVVAGPNFGLNLGPFLYTLSGTMGYTYAAVGRGYPAIAFSGGNSEQRSYQWINKTTASGSPDPATVQGQLAVDVVNQVLKATPKGQRVLPLGYGINVNTPLITSLTNNSCVAPSFVQTRFTGGAFTDRAAYNATRGTFTYANLLGSGVNRPINGDPRLPGETTILGSGCQASVSVFTVDYDAPLGPDQDGVRRSLAPLVKFQAPAPPAPPGPPGPPGYGPGKPPVKRELSEREIEERAPLRHP